MFRPAPGSSPTAIPSPSRWNASTRPRRCFARRRKRGALRRAPDAGNSANIGRCYYAGMRLIRLLDRAVGQIVSLGQWLVIPIVVLLFLQWPLRDIIQAWSRETNDLGQWIFAFYVAVSVTAATRAKTHLTADTLARHYSVHWRNSFTRLGAAIGLVPLSLFVLFASRNIVWSSLLMRESFPDTYNAGYFLIKLALWVLALLMLIEGLIDIARPVRETAR